MRAYIYTGGEVDLAHIEERPEADDLVIAADAGYLTARRMGVLPSLLVGDMDSLGGAERQAREEGVDILKVPCEKDETDTQLAVAEALKRGARELCIIGGLEGRLDHTLSLLALLEELDARGVRAYVNSGRNRARFVRRNGLLLPRSEFRYFGLLAADEKVKGVTVEGAKYPLKRATLYRAKGYAVSNEIEGNCALIEVGKGGLFVIESRE